LEERRKLVEVELVGNLGRKEGERNERKKKNWKIFASHWSKQLVEEIGGLNEVIYGSGWVHLIRKKNGKSLAYLRASTTTSSKSFFFFFVI
jgi:hypothetical protein